MTRQALPAALLALTLAFASAPAGAATDDPGALPPPGEEYDSSGNPDDGELTDFVAAFVRLVSVQHGYMMLMQEEQDPARLEELKSSALVDMEEAVRKDGMSVDRYNQIALALREDPDLQQRVEGILQQLAVDPDATEE